MSQAGVTSLTTRERECLSLVARDRGSGEIAAELGLAVSTVQNHIKSARAKLGGVDRFTAARIVAEAEGTSHSLASLRLVIASGADGPIVRPSSTVVNNDGNCDAVRKVSDEFAPSAGKQANEAAPSRKEGPTLANLTTLQRIACIVAFAIAITFGFAVFVSAFQGVSQLSISLPG